MSRDGKAYERFSDTVDGPLLILAVLWLPVLIVPLAAQPAPGLAASLDAIDYAVWAVFAVEYLVKLGLAPNRWRFVRTHLVDLLVTAIPFLRPLRLARLLRLLRLARVVTVLGNVLRRARRILTHKGLHFVLLSVVLIVFAAAAVELGFEHHQRGANIHTFSDAIWWAMVTVTTVGYGDRFPVTAAGRGAAVVLMLAVSAWSASSPPPWRPISSSNAKTTTLPSSTGVSTGSNSCSRRSVPAPTGRTIGYRAHHRSPRSDRNRQ